MSRVLIPLIAGVAGLIAIACSSGGETDTTASTPAGTALVAVAAPTTAPTRAAEPVDQRDERYGGVLRIAQPGDPISCDLAMSRGVGYQSVHPCNPMLSQIVRASAGDHGVILPDLATEYSLSPDGRTWTFELREDARWHDGTPVTADDLKFSLDRVINPPEGLLVGLDYSSGMLAKAQGKVQRKGWGNVRLIQADARALCEDLLKARAGVDRVDAVL